jgi:NAD+ diphosphatase
MLGARTEATSTAISLDPEELEQALWLTREDLVTVFAGKNPLIRPSRKGAIANFILHAWLADRLD